MTWFFLLLYLLYEAVTGRPLVSRRVRRKWQPADPEVVRGSQRRGLD